MARVLFDLTRITSALGQVPQKPHLFLVDLARLVEAIVLYEEVLTTVPTKVFRRELTNRSPFDFTKTHVYEPLFNDILKDIPENHTDSNSMSSRCELLSSQSLRSNPNWSGDIVTLHALTGTVTQQDFMFDFESTLTNDGLLASISRVRMLLTLAREHNLPYEPIPFRIPIADHLCPSNLEIDRFKGFKDFEKAVYSYIQDVGGGDPLQLNMPMLFNIVLNEAKIGDPDSIFAVAVQLRNDPLIVNLREIFDRFTTAASLWDHKLMSRLKRQFESEAKRLVAVWSETVSLSMEVKFKFDWPPIGASFDLRRWLQDRKDRDIRPAVANLGRLTENSFLTLDPTLKRVEQLFGTRVQPDELRRIARLTAKPIVERH